MSASHAGTQQCLLLLLQKQLSCLCSICHLVEDSRHIGCRAMSRLLRPSFKHIALAAKPTGRKFVQTNGLLRGRPNECPWRGGGGNTAGELKQAPHGLLPHRGPRWVAWHASAWPAGVCWKGKVAAVRPFAVSSSPPLLRRKQEGTRRSCLPKYHHFQIPLLISTLLPCC